ncbi:hypothetical protein A5651_09130 [Mycobacterium sp. 1274761.0]|nr:hypothetical protein A5651_09130 [Mycobacterium sp. 1274761.0]
MRTVRSASWAAAAAMGLVLGPTVIPASAYAADVCADIGGAVDRGGLCQVHESTPNYTLDMSFPVDFPNQAAVNDFITQTRNGFLNETRSPNFANVPYVLDMKATRWASHTTTSVSFETYEDLGGAHPTTWFRTFNYDMVRNRPITFSDLFAPGTDPLKAILPVVTKKLESEMGTAPPILDGAGTDPANYQNFAVTPSDVVFFFDRGALMPGAAGTYTVYVPRNVIPPLNV